MAMAIDSSQVREMRFNDFLFALMTVGADSAWGQTRVAMAVAFGNHPDRLESDQGFAEFVDRYLAEVMIPYAARASMQIAIFDVLRSSKTGAVAEAFLTEAEKVMPNIFGDEEAAEAVAQDEVRRWHFFIAVVGLTVIGCHQSKEMAKLFGFRQTLMGKWKRIRR